MPAEDGRRGAGRARAADRDLEAAALRGREASQQEVQLAILRIENGRAQRKPVPETLDDLLYGMAVDPYLAGGDATSSSSSSGAVPGIGSLARGGADFARLAAAIQREPQKWVESVNLTM